MLLRLCFEANILMRPKAWMLDLGCTKHFCGNENPFTTYNPIEKGTENVNMGDSRSTFVVGKGKVVLKVMSGKVLSLNDVLHKPSVRHDLASVSFLGKAGIKLIFDGDLFILNKNVIFVGKVYLDEFLYVLNVHDMINDNASSSFVYFIDSFLMRGMLDLDM